MKAEQPYAPNSFAPTLHDEASGQSGFPRLAAESAVASLIAAIVLSG
jgi:hypothetical protein